MAEQDTDETRESSANDATPPAASGPSARRRSLGSEFLDYLMQNKKWWMVPIVVMVLLLALVLILSSTPAMTFIYPLF